MLKIRILTASILGLALLLSLFGLPPGWTVAVFALVLSLAAWEWAGFGALRRSGARLAYVACIAALLWASWSYTHGNRQLLLLLLKLACVWWICAFAWLTLAPSRHRPALTLSCGVPVLVPPFMALARVQVSPRGFARGPEMVLWMLLLVFAADIGAYFTGRALAGKLAPRVSPGKTWEGAIGGLVAVALVAWAGAEHFGLSVAAGVTFGCAVGVYSVIGDLTESMFKRAAGLKDSGSILPGHGGVLDRIDSVTAAAPLYALGLLGSGVIE